MSVTATLREIDRHVATRIMGWSDVNDGFYGVGPDGRIGVTLSPVPRFSSDIGSAWHVAAAVWQGDIFRIWKDMHDVWHVRGSYEDSEIYADFGTDPDNADVDSFQSDAALAICIAALKTRGITVFPT